MAPSAVSNYLLIGNLVDFTGATGRSGQAWGQAIIDSANWVNENGGVAGKLFDLDTSKHRTSCEEHCLLMKNG